MISNLIGVVLATQSMGASTLLDRASTNLSKLKRFHVQIVVNTKSGSKSLTTTYDLSVSHGNGESVVMQVREPAQDGKSASDRSYSIIGKTFVSYDSIADEYLDRKIPTTGPILDRLASVVGPVDEPVRVAIETGSLARFYKSLKSNRDWKVESTAISRRAGTSFTRVSFDRSSGLMSTLDFGNGKQDSAIRFKYSALSSEPKLTLPASARKVNAFFAAPMPPKFASAGAEKVTQAMNQAYRRLVAGRIEVNDGKDSSTITFGNGQFQERTPKFEWSYDGNVLTVYNREKGIGYEGKTGRSRVLTIVASLGGTVDPITRQLLAKVPPFVDLFSAKSSVALGGKIEIGGKTNDLLKCDSGSIRLSLLVRSDNHLIESLTSESLDRQQNIVFSSTRKFEYRDLGRVPSQSEITIKLPEGTLLRPLPGIRYD